MATEPTRPHPDDPPASVEALQREIAALRRLLGDSRAEEAARSRELADEERLFRHLFESSSDAIFVEDLDGFVLDVNPAACRLHGMASDELIGKHVLQLVPPQVRDEVAEGFGQLIAGGPGHVDGYSYTRDNVAIPVEIRVSQVTYRDRDALLLHVRDVSERKRAEREREALRRLSQRLTGPLAPREIGRVVAAEARELFDHDFLNLAYYDPVANQVVGLWCEDTPAGASAPIEMPNEATPILEYRTEPILLNRSGDDDGPFFEPMGDVTRRSSSLMFAPVPWAGRSVVGLVSVQSYSEDRYDERDLALLEAFAAQCGGALARLRVETERERLEEKVRQTQKLESLGVLAGGLAHDFNNLLVGVLGHSELAQFDLAPDSQARRSLQEVERAATRAGELCRQMLAYSGQGSVEVRLLDVHDVAQEIGRLLDVTVSRKADLRFRCEGEVPRVRADVTQIRQILMNLITNASDAIGIVQENAPNGVTAAKGAITVTTAVEEHAAGGAHDTVLAEDLAPGRYVTITVDDDGCGMDEEVQRRIFDPFFTTKVTGRGLGLATVLGTIRAHGGAIRLRSQPGEGTSFTVLLPVAEEGATDDVDEVAAHDEWRGHGVALVIDDDAMVRDVAMRMLEHLGFTSAGAATGREAVSVFERHGDAVTCCLLDLSLPESDGLSPFAALRGAGMLAPVVVASGGSLADAEAPMASGDFAGVIQKPFRIDQLAGAMRAALGDGPGLRGRA